MSPLVELCCSRLQAEVAAATEIFVDLPRTVISCPASVSRTHLTDRKSVASPLPPELPDARSRPGTRHRGGRLLVPRLGCWCAPVARGIVARFDDVRQRVTVQPQVANRTRLQQQDLLPTYGCTGTLSLLFHSYTTKHRASWRRHESQHGGRCTCSTCACPTLGQQSVQALAAAQGRGHRLKACGRIQPRVIVAANSGNRKSCQSPAAAEDTLQVKITRRTAGGSLEHLFA